MSYNVPILFQFYNNYETTIRVFSEIRKVKPQYLYLVQDKYRNTFPIEEAECLTVRQAVLEGIDWDCKLITLFRESNLGPGAGTADALKWFFKQVEYGIILEHDCLPHPDFFEYCSTLLELYKDAYRIKIINGSNFQMNKKFNNASYYFGASGQLWGWASWSRSFINYTSEINEIDLGSLTKDIKSTFKTKRVQEYWINTYNWIKEGIVDTWDYQLLYMIWKEKGLLILPNVNLITNIGFGEKSLHCKNKLSILSDSKTENILPLKHPKRVKRSYSSDINYHDNYLSHTPIEKMNLFICLKRKLKKYIPVSIYTRIKKHPY